MLKDPDIDLVHINSPIPDHGWMSIESLKAGKNVMCTVPMSTSIEECKQIVDLVKDDNVLEIGCGWGGFAEYVGKNYDVKLDCITTVSYTHLRAHETPEHRVWPGLL